MAAGEEVTRLLIEWKSGSSEAMALDDALNALAVVDPRFPQVNEAQDWIKSL